MFTSLVLPGRDLTKHVPTAAQTEPEIEPDSEDEDDLEIEEDEETEEDLEDSED